MEKCKYCDLKKDDFGDYYGKKLLLGDVYVGGTDLEMSTYISYDEGCNRLVTSIGDDEGDWERADIKINFCPMCGRKL